MATDWGALATELQQLNALYEGGNFSKSHKARFDELRTTLATEDYLPDPIAFDPAAFDPYAHLTQSSRERPRYGYYRGGDFDPASTSGADLQRAQELYTQAEGELAGTPVNTFKLDYSLATRNARFKDYATLFKSVQNTRAQAAQAQAQTRALQGRARQAAGSSEFFNLGEPANPDVRIGSNIATPTKRKTSSVDATTARRRMVVRAPGINI